MSYPLVSIPVFAKKDFFLFNKVEAKQYLDWFLEIRSERQSILKNNVNIQFPEWNLDYSPYSLIRLYEWFKNRIAYRPMTPNEKKSIDEQIYKTPLFVGNIPITDLAFTDETVSICFDIGIYFGQILVRNIEELIWSYKVTSVNFIYYAQPILVKRSSKLTTNPRASIEGIARRVLDKDSSEITFEELYNRLNKKYQ